MASQERPHEELRPFAHLVNAGYQDVQNHNGKNAWLADADLMHMSEDVALHSEGMAERLEFMHRGLFACIGIELVSHEVQGFDLQKRGSVLKPRVAELAAYTFFLESLNEFDLSHDPDMESVLVLTTDVLAYIGEQVRDTHNSIDAITDPDHQDRAIDYQLWTAAQLLSTYNQLHLDDSDAYTQLRRYRRYRAEGVLPQHLEGERLGLTELFAPEPGKAGVPGLRPPQIRPAVLDADEALDYMRDCTAIEEKFDFTEYTRVWNERLDHIRALRKVPETEVMAEDLGTIARGVFEAESAAISASAPRLGLMLLQRVATQFSAVRLALREL